MESRIQNGQLVRCVVSGFEGRVTGLCFYETGRAEALVTPYGLTGNGKRRTGLWFSVENLEIRDAQPLVLPGVAASERDQKRVPGSRV